MIAITFALPTESANLRRKLRDLRDDGHLVSGKIDEHGVTVLHTGVGAKNCNERVEMLLHKARPRLVISSGFAGAVTAELNVGDITLAENFSDRKLLSRAEKILPDCNPRVVKLFTSTSIIDSTAERTEIAGASGAAAVDMETGAIVGVCNAHGVPLLSLRAISDTPGDPFPVPPSILFDVEGQQTNYGRFFAYLLRDPAAAWRLFKFARKIARGRAALTHAIVALVHEL
jgi:adenosylhomocysteine nucleosidase